MENYYALIYIFEQAHDYSVNWIVDHGQPEIVNGSTGKTINENTSRLSKKSRKLIKLKL